MTTPRPPRLRVWRDPAAEGATNMALDEALAVDAARGADVLVRLSTWARPTVSLGAFQRIGDARACPALAGLAIVRRPSGGGAIVHGSDVTLAIALPRGHAFGESPQSLYDLVHGALVAELARLGVAAGLSEGVPVLHGIAAPRDTSATPDGPLFCFDRRAAGDVVLPAPGGNWRPAALRPDAKILGSAQRRLPGAVLQHGSLLLAANREVPPAARHPGLLDLARDASRADASLAPEPIVERWLEGIARGLGLVVTDEAGPFAPGDEAVFQETLARYGAESWIARR